MKIKDYSQHGEQKILLEWFQRHGHTNKFLVDVGAFGKEISNTFGLLKYGWEGLLIEASNIRFRILVEDVHGLNARVVNCAAGNSAGKLPLYIHTVAGHDSFLKDWGHSELTGSAPLVPMYPLSEILRDWSVPENFDLLSIDTEGMDMMIMKKYFEDGLYRARVIVTEVESYPDAVSFFKAAGYKHLKHVGDPVFGNSIFTTMSE